jgi:mRNA-degrading endonuclease toxin of MazEF toxin-antitoxin module
MFSQRDIVPLSFPYSDLTGAEQRPALIVSNDKLNKTHDKICCLITSNQPKDGIEITEKLPFKSWLKPHRLFTIREKIIKKKLCMVSPQFHDLVLTSVNSYLKRE